MELAMNKLCSIAIITIIFAITSGCISQSQTSLAKEHIKDFLSPPTEQDRYNREVSALLDKKVELIHNQLANNLTLYTDGKYNYFTYSNLDKISKLLHSEIITLLEGFTNNKEDIKKNKKLIGVIAATNSDLNTTLAKLDSYFQNHAQDFDNIYGQGLALNIGSYCESAMPPNSSCYREINGTRVATPSDILVPMLLKKRLFEIYPEHKKYFEKYYNELNESVKKLTDIAREIKEYSINYEYNLYLKEASKRTGHAFTNFDSDDGTFLSTQMGYASFRPKHNTIYDLSNFKVMQSVNSGMLLTPYEYTNYLNTHQVIFVETSKIFTDNHVFIRGDEKVYLTGIKDYGSILGTRKKVYSFKIVPKTKTTFYFLNL